MFLLAKTCSKDDSANWFVQLLYLSYFNVFIEFVCAD